MTLTFLNNKWFRKNFRCAPLSVLTSVGDWTMLYDETKLHPSKIQLNSLALGIGEVLVGCTFLGNLEPIKGQNLYQMAPTNDYRGGRMTVDFDIERKTATVLGYIGYGEA